MTNAHCHLLAVSASGDHALALQQCHRARPPRHQEAEEINSGCRLLCCWSLGGLAFGHIFECLSVMVYNHTVQGFEKPNTTMTIAEEYLYSLFGIVLGFVGTYLSRLVLAIYVGVLAKRVVCREVLRIDIWRSMMYWSTGFFIGDYVVLLTMIMLHKNIPEINRGPVVLDFLLLGKEQLQSFPTRLLMLVIDWIEKYAFFHIAKKTQASKVPITMKVKEVGGGDTNYAV
jgi:hypothetical protein